MSTPTRPTPNRPPTREPQRHLDPALARAITAAKERTGRSWRQLATFIPVSHSHLINIANGKRVPSAYVAEYMIAGLALDEATAAGLRAVAVPTGRPWDGPEQIAAFQEPRQLPTETTGIWEPGDVEGRHGSASR